MKVACKEKTGGKFGSKKKIACRCLLKHSLTKKNNLPKNKIHFVQWQSCFKCSTENECLLYVWCAGMPMKLYACSVSIYRYRVVIDLKEKRKKGAENDWCEWLKDRWILAHFIVKDLCLNKKRPI